MDIKIGYRKLQAVNGAFLLNIPMYAARTLDLHARDTMSVVLTEDGALRIEKENNPATGAELGSATPVASLQHTREVIADVNQS